MTWEPSLSGPPGRVDTAARYELDANMARGSRRAQARGAGRAGSAVRVGCAVLAGALAAAACDNLSPEMSAVASKDDGRGAIVVGHFASMTGPEVTWGVSTD